MKNKGLKNIIIIATIMLSSGILMADLAMYPAYELMCADFPNASTGVLNFILTGPSLVLIFTSILCGVLAQYLGKKKIVAFAYTVHD